MPRVEQGFDRTADHFNPKVLEIILSQPHVPWENAAYILPLLIPFSYYYYTFYQVPISAGVARNGGFNAGLRFVHTDSPAGIEPQTQSLI